MNENNYYEDKNQEQNAQAEEPVCENNDTPVVSVHEASSEGEARDAVVAEADSGDGIVHVVQPTVEEKKEQPAQSMAITSMILAIVSQVCGVGLPLSIVALVLGCVAKKRGNTSGFATAGVVIGIISTALWTLLILVFVLIIFIAYMVTNLAV